MAQGWESSAPQQYPLPDSLGEGIPCYEDGSQPYFGSKPCDWSQAFATASGC